MILGQSAATAAALAIDSEQAVQDVPYARLRERLLQDGQVLADATATTVGKTSGTGAVDWKKLPGIVVDDSAARVSGNWKSSRAAATWIGESYRHDENARDGRATARFVAQLPAAGRYEVRLAYTPHANRSSKTAVEIEHATGLETRTINQRQTPSLDNQFITLGVFEFAQDKPAAIVISNRDADGYVIIDAIQWLPAGGLKKSWFMKTCGDRQDPLRLPAIVIHQNRRMSHLAFLHAWPLLLVAPLPVTTSGRSRERVSADQPCMTAWCPCCTWAGSGRSVQESSRPCPLPACALFPYWR